jgi:hypothetical protein
MLQVVAGFGAVRAFGSTLQIFAIAVAAASTATTTTAAAPTFARELASALRTFALGAGVALCRARYGARFVVALAWRIDILAGTRLRSVLVALV